MHTFTNGESFFQATFECAGLRRHPVITCGGHSVSAHTAATALPQWRDALTSGSSAPFDPANMGASWSVIEVKCLVMSTGTLTTATLPLSVVGTDSALSDNPSPNVSIVVAKRTGIAGNKNRGRLFAPPSGIAESWVDNAGIIGSTHVTTLQGYWNHVFSIMDSADFTPAILHDDSVGGGWTACTDFLVTPLVGTNRRRIR